MNDIHSNIRQCADIFPLPRDQISEIDERREELEIMTLARKDCLGPTTTRKGLLVACCMLIALGLI
jgi:hypothetical protein